MRNQHLHFLFIALLAPVIGCVAPSCYQPIPVNSPSSSAEWVDYERSIQKEHLQVTPETIQNIPEVIDSGTQSTDKTNTSPKPDPFEECKEFCKKRGCSLCMCMKPCTMDSQCGQCGESPFICNQGKCNLDCYMIGCAKGLICTKGHCSKPKCRPCGTGWTCKDGKCVPNP